MTATRELTLQDIVDAFKPKMDGHGHVIQAHEKAPVPSDPEHAGEAKPAKEEDGRS